MSGLYQQILLSLQKVLVDPVRPLCSHYGAVVGLHALGWKVRTQAFLSETGERLGTVCVCVPSPKHMLAGGSYGVSERSC